VEDLLDRVEKAEERINKQDAITTRSHRANLALGPLDTTKQMTDLEDHMAKFQERLEEVETIVD
jgi:hypothetical protein